MMQKKVKSALISVFYKDGLEPVIELLDQLGVTIYSTGGTRDFIEKLGVRCIPVEDLTSYPSILGGRVKTLHPKIFGGILGRRALPGDLQEMEAYGIPEIDLVIVDLYPFEETVAATTDEKQIIEKIDIGGPSMIRAAAKNFSDLVVVASKNDYAELTGMLRHQGGSTTFDQRREFARKAFNIVGHYDIAIAGYFNAAGDDQFFLSAGQARVMRYGENPHQKGVFYGNLEKWFEQLSGKELSYNNLVDVDAALQLVADFPAQKPDERQDAVFAIIKHTNVCGIASRGTGKEAWEAALAGDPESAFGGVLICNRKIDLTTAGSIHEIFFEVLIAPAFDDDALQLLRTRKNRILLKQLKFDLPDRQFKSLLEGVLVQETDRGLNEKWEETGGRATSPSEQEDLNFANIICKHLKSNAIALVKNKQLIGKGCGQTSRIDALRQALEKSKQFGFSLQGAVMASDAFFPFDDCVRMGHEAGITAFIQPGGSIRDKESIEYCKSNQLAMVITGMRHFRH
jgi:phosphoribosylaminoimidazolecarboxamide formyltransferase/IMP cyclohydrolase